MASFTDYIDLLKSEVKLFINRKCSKSAIVLRTYFDNSVAIRQRCRIYDSCIGRYSFVGRNSLLQNVEIGNYCSISEGCLLGLPAHPTSMVSTSPVFLNGKNVLKKNFAQIPFEDTPKTIIGSDVWIGANVLVKAGIKIGNGAVIGAGAVVVKDVPPFSIVGGVPAKIIGYRFSEEIIKKLEDDQWWLKNDKEIEEFAIHFSSVPDYLDSVRKF